MRQPKTDAELRQLALDIVGGSVFTDRHVPDHDKGILGSIFMPLMLMSDEQRQELVDNDVTLLYEYLSQANNMGINGYPSFMSMQYLTNTEVGTLYKYVEELKEFQQAGVQT